MIESIMTTWNSYIQQFSAGNEFAAGMLSIWALTVVTYLLRSVPKMVYLFLKRQLTTTVTMNNGGWDEKDTMINFMNWAVPQIKEQWSRTLSVETGNTTSIGLGYGVHFFLWDKRLFWLKKEKLESSGSERQKEEIMIGTFGRSHKPFHKMREAFTPKRDDDKLRVYQLDVHGEWNCYNNINKRPFESVAMDQNVKDFIYNQIKHFKDNRGWYLNKGLPHKLTFLLEGPPGTGKTSLIKSVSSEFGMNLCLVNINHMTDKLLERGFAQVPDNSVIVMEDFDSSSATKDRGAVQTVMSNDMSEMMGSLSLTGLLNALDGVNPLDNCLVFLTTNHKEQLDAAIYRKGRVDHILNIGEVGGEDIKKYSQYLYPDHDFNRYIFNSGLGCKLNEALLAGKEDAETYVASLKENKIVE